MIFLHNIIQHYREILVMAKVWCLLLFVFCIVGVSSSQYFVITVGRRLSVRIWHVFHFSVLCSRRYISFKLFYLYFLNDMCNVPVFSPEKSMNHKKLCTHSRCAVPHLSTSLHCCFPFKQIYTLIKVKPKKRQRIKVKPPFCWLLFIYIYIYLYTHVFDCHC